MTPVINQRVTVAGLGRFGGQIAVARWLVEQGATVLVTDQSPADSLADSIEQLRGLPIAFRLGEHRAEDFEGADLIVASPAVPPGSEFLRRARAAGVPITTEIRLFIERCPAPIVGVTGTKGKSTTTALLGEMLGTKFATHVGGNIGRSLLPQLPNIDAADKVVLELSSYMLEHLGAARWSPALSVVTMLAADHLAWHGSLENYLSAKANVVRFQGPRDVAVLSARDEASKKLAGLTAARVVRFAEPGFTPLELALPGEHNQLNAQAALTAAIELGVARTDAARAVARWTGLPHRLQRVHEANGVAYFNDSIATIPQAAIVALHAFDPGRVIQIVGGSNHHLPIDGMCAALACRARAVLCIGQTGQAVADRLASAATAMHAAGARAAEIHRCGNLETALAVARRIAVPGDIVLLSPGYKSYDQFTNFEERGTSFTRLARGENN